MSVPPKRVLPLLGIVREDLTADVSLHALSRIARRSPFEVHRAFRLVTGETTKGFTSRLRLDYAAAQLLLGKQSVLAIALESGFASHEVFTRSFARRFGMSPRAYRARGLAGGDVRSIAARHAQIVREAGPCIGLHHLSTARRNTVSVNVSLKSLEPRAALVIRRKTSAADIAKTLAEILPAVFAYATKNGIPFAGPPFTRYLTTGRGLLGIEAGLPIAAGGRGEGEIVVTELPGGTAAVAIHAGAYETLEQTHAAVERFIDANGHESAGGPWETYLTDPGDKPDPADWRTEVVYPLKR